MNKKIFTRILVALLALVMIIGLLPVVSLAAEEEVRMEWAKVDPAELKDGDIIAITSDNATKATEGAEVKEYLLSGTSDVERPVPVEVTLVNGKLETVDAAHQLTVELGEGGVYLKNADGKYLNWPSSNKVSFNTTEKTDSCLWIWHADRAGEGMGLFYNRADSLADSTKEGRWLCIYDITNKPSEWRVANKTNNKHFLNETVTVWRYQAYVDPAIEALSGYYALYHYNNMNDGAFEDTGDALEFFPSAEGALDGTIKFTYATSFDDSDARVFAYSYADGVLTMTDITGDGVTKPYMINISDWDSMTFNGTYLVRTEKPIPPVLTLGTNSYKVEEGNALKTVFYAPADGLYYFSAAQGDTNAHLSIEYKRVYGYVTEVIDDNRVLALRLEKGERVNVIVQTQDKKAGTVNFVLESSYDTIKSVLAGTAGNKFSIQAEIIFIDGNTVYVEDSTGAMTVAMDTVPAAWAVGGDVVVTGTLAFPNGLPQLQNVTATYTADAENKLDSAAKIIASNSKFDKVLCHLVQLNGKYKVISVTEDSVVLKDTENGMEATLYKPAETLKVGDLVQRVEGVMSTNDGYRVISTSILYTPGVEEDGSGDSNQPGDSTAPAGTEYYLGVVHGGLGNKEMFFNGSIDNAEYRMDIVEAYKTEPNGAVKVTLEETAGGYNLYFMKDGVKTYIIPVKSGTYNNINLSTAPGGVWTWNAEHETLVANIEGTDCIMAASRSYENFEAKKLEQISSLYPVKLYTELPTKGAGDSAGDETDAYPLPPITDPVVGNGYLFGMYQNGIDKVVYVTGVADGEYLGVTENTTEAATVYVEASGEGLKFYVMDNGHKSYIELYLNDDGKAKVGYGRDGSVFTYNAEKSSWVTEFEGSEYYLGTYSSYETIGSSYSTYITANNKGSAQYPAGFMSLVSSGDSTDSNPDNGDNSFVFVVVGLASMMAVTALVVTGKKRMF